MLNVTHIRGSNQYAAAHYFSNADDYYTKEEHGYWQGSGAEALGLVGAVDRAEFARLLNGQLPNGERIQATFDKDGKKRMGLDLTFSAPKSVSLQGLVAGDKDVTEAHDRAVAYALGQVEQLAVARRKERGKTYRERTGNMVIGKFRHELSRAKDPQLHTHAIVLNMTQRGDGAWRALSNEDIFKVQHQLDAYYKAELAKGLRELGYGIRLLDAAGNFELEHISRDQVEAFSARSKVIEDALAKQGKTRATAMTLEKQIIALATRPRKDERDRELIKEWWVTKSRELGINYGARSRLDGRSYEAGSANHTAESAAATRSQGVERSGAEGLSQVATPGLNARPFIPRPVEPGVAMPPLLHAHTAPSGGKALTPAEVVVDYAIRHLTEREAVVTEEALITNATQRAVGLAGPAEVKARIDDLAAQGTLIEAPITYRMTTSLRLAEHKPLSRGGWEIYLREAKGWSTRRAREYVEQAISRGSLVPDEKRYTTQKALKREKAILAIERDGRGAVAPIRPVEDVRIALEGSTLNAGQRAAVEVIVSSLNRFVGIQGDAGTGKTYTINQAINLVSEVETIGQEGGYRVVALAPYGNQVKALKGEGMDAHTLASFLHSKEKPIDDRTIIVLDESGVVGARQMEQLMRTVEQAGARLVLVGDTKQTEAIESGKPFAQLQERGMQTARISEIQRQKNDTLRTAVELAAEGRPAQSLDYIKHVEVEKDPSVRHQSMVDEFMKLPPEQRLGTLMVSGLNADRREINQMTREALGLVGKGTTHETLLRVDSTQAQRRYAPSYEKGMVIQPERDYPKAGLMRHENYRVVEHKPGNELVLQRPDGTLATINPRKITKLSVYHSEQAEFAPGDLVRINRNDARMDLTNGDRYRVASTLGGMIKLESLELRDGQAVRVVELPTNKPLHLEHAYSTTVHSAQGLTSDRVLISMRTKSRTTSMNLYYVAISRARHEARIYTDDASELRGAIGQKFTKTMASSVQRSRDRERQISGLTRYTPSTGRSSLSRQNRPSNAELARDKGQSLGKFD